MLVKKHNKDVVQASNPLAQYDPDQPPFIPATFKRTYKRSVYVPERKASLLYQISQMIKESTRAGTKLSFNDVVIEALEFWYRQNICRHLAWILHRLVREDVSLASKHKKLGGRSKKTSEAKELSRRQAKISAAISKIQNFLYEDKQIVPTRDYETLITEIIQSLKKHSSIEMSRALSKVLSRSDIQEVANRVRHKPKIKKKSSTFRIKKNEEREWYE